MTTVIQDADEKYLVQNWKKEKKETMFCDHLKAKINGCVQKFADKQLRSQSNGSKEFQEHKLRLENIKKICEKTV